ncbi:aspartate/glutamate racemase family protein [Streptomyces sp. NPDC047434]|uniref:aspartate/glutamate racemase family protein n=1 Tax=Streptomyces sp. NPDC047434 TaxID=3155143 RepID=UPI0033D14FF4
MGTGRATATVGTGAAVPTGTVPAREAVSAVPGRLRASPGDDGPGAPAIVLINPNTAVDTTATMAAIARRTLGPGVGVRGVTVARGPRMLTDPAALRAAAAEVATAGRQALAEGRCRALLVAAFGDPGVAELRSLALHAAGGPVPVVGIGEAALLEAAASGRPFGIATTTPLLAGPVVERVAALGLADRFTGLRLTEGDPEQLAAHPESLHEALAGAVRACVAQDGARAVVIGGGPLGEAAEVLRARFETPVIAPIPAACRRIARLLGVGSPPGRAGSPRAPDPGAGR